MGLRTRARTAQRSRSYHFEARSKAYLTNRLNRSEADARSCPLVFNQQVKYRAAPDPALSRRHGLDGTYVVEKAELSYLSFLGRSPYKCKK